MDGREERKRKEERTREKHEIGRISSERDHFTSGIHLYYRFIFL